MRQDASEPHLPRTATSYPTWRSICWRQKKKTYWCGKWSSLRISEARCHPLIFFTISLRDLPCSFKATEWHPFIPTFISVDVVKSRQQKQISCYSNCRNLHPLCGFLLALRVNWLSTTECDPSRKEISKWNCKRKMSTPQVMFFFFCCATIHLQVTKLEKSHRKSPPVKFNIISWIGFFLFFFLSNWWVLISQDHFIG